MPSTETQNLDTYIRDFRNEPDIADQHKEAVMELVNALAAEGAGNSRQRKYIYALTTIRNRFSPGGLPSPWRLPSMYQLPEPI